MGFHINNYNSRFSRSYRYSIFLPKLRFSVPDIGRERASLKVLLTVKTPPLVENVQGLLS